LDAVSFSAVSRLRLSRLSAAEDSPENDSPRSGQANPHTPPSRRLLIVVDLLPPACGATLSGDLTAPFGTP
jgi:hypothetical protein